MTRLDDETFGQVRTALLEHCVMSIREQDLEPEPRLEFGKRFGKLVMSKGTEDVDKPMMIGPLKEYPQILRLQNFGKNKQLPKRGMRTTFTCQARRPFLSWRRKSFAGRRRYDVQQSVSCVEGLSDRMKRLLRGLRLSTLAPISQLTAKNFAGELPSAIHPVVCTHPDTRRRHSVPGLAPA